MLGQRDVPSGPRGAVGGGPHEGGGAYGVKRGAPPGARAALAEGGMPGVETIPD